MKVVSIDSVGPQISAPEGVPTTMGRKMLRIGFKLHENRAPKCTVHFLESEGPSQDHTNGLGCRLHVFYRVLGSKMKLWLVFWHLG